MGDIINMPFTPPNNHPTPDSVISTLIKAKPVKVCAVYQTNDSLFVISNDLCNRDIIWLLDRAKFMNHSA